MVQWNPRTQQIVTTDFSQWLNIETETDFSYNYDIKDACMCSLTVLCSELILKFLWLSLKRLKNFSTRINSLSSLSYWFLPRWRPTLKLFLILFYSFHNFWQFLATGECKAAFPSFLGAHGFLPYQQNQFSVELKDYWSMLPSLLRQKITFLARSLMIQ